jgi:hypothetical protein
MNKYKMSAGTNAFGAKAGFNQSGGGHFMTLAALDGNYTASAALTPYINVLVTPGSNSGGAFSNPTLALTNMSTVLASVNSASALTASTLVGPNKMLKDMGRTVVSAGRTFRKFAPVVAGLASTFGVTGPPGSTTSGNAGFGAFYLEVGREGVGATPAPIVRYF